MAKHHSIGKGKPSSRNKAQAINTVIRFISALPVETLGMVAAQWGVEVEDLKNDIEYSILILAAERGDKTAQAMLKSPTISAGMKVTDDA